MGDGQTHNACATQSLYVITPRPPAPDSLPPMPMASWWKGRAMTAPLSSCWKHRSSCGGCVGNGCLQLLLPVDQPPHVHATLPSPLPPVSIYQLMQRIAAATTKPLIVVLVHGGPLDVSELAASSRVGALLTLWYPGQAGSAALGDILAGRLSPSGRPSSMAGLWSQLLASGRRLAASLSSQLSCRPLTQRPVPLCLQPQAACL